MIEDKYGVRLGPIDRIHLPKLRAWRNDPKIYKTCRQSTLISDADQERWFESQSKDPSILMYTIQALDDKKDSRLIGVCGLTSIDRSNQRAEFSLYIGPEHHGNGLGAKALKTLLNHAFRDLNLNTVWGECFDTNKFALNIFTDVGMKKEGIRREFYYKDGQYIGAHLISMTRNDWMSLWPHWHV